ncbi:plac8 family protein [Nannochloropsis oceanica]
MTTLQREERNGLRDEEEAGGPMYLLPPDSECNDAEDDKLLSPENLLPAVFVSVGPTSSNPFEQASSLSPSPKSPPRGRWKDGFCDWHKDCLHSCLLGSLLNCVLLGQVAQRMKFCMRFKEVTLVSLGLWTLSCVLYVALPKNVGPGGLANVAYSLFFLLVLCQLRGMVRSRDAIPGDRFWDCCASLWCSCCTLTQMARHVFHYQDNHADCSLRPGSDSFVTVI